MVVIVTMISLYCDGRCHKQTVLVGSVIVTVAVLVTVMVLIVEMVSSVSWFKVQVVLLQRSQQSVKKHALRFVRVSLVRTRGADICPNI